MASGNWLLGIILIIAGILYPFNNLGLFSLFEATNPYTGGWNAVGDTVDFDEVQRYVDGKITYEELVVKNPASSIINKDRFQNEESFKNYLSSQIKSKSNTLNSGKVGVVNLDANPTIYSGSQSKWQDFIQRPVSATLESGKTLTIVSKQPFNERNARMFVNHIDGNPAELGPIDIGISNADATKRYCSFRVSNAHVLSNQRVMEIDFNKSNINQMAVGFGINAGQASVPITSTEGFLFGGEPGTKPCRIETSEPVYMYVETGGIKTDIAVSIIEIPVRIKEVNVTVVETVEVVKEVVKEVRVIDSQGNEVQKVEITDENIKEIQAVDEEGNPLQTLIKILLIGGGILLIAI